MRVGLLFGKSGRSKKGIGITPISGLEDPLPDDGSGDGGTTEPDDPEPPPGDGGNAGPLAGLAEFESVMFDPGLQIARGWADGSLARVDHYDADLAFRFIRDYQNAGTNSDWHRGHIGGRDNYIDYVLRNGYSAGWNAYPIGVHHGWTIDGHQPSLDCLTALCDNPWIVEHPRENRRYQDYSREFAYGLLTLVMYEKAMGTQAMNNVTLGYPGIWSDPVEVIHAHMLDAMEHHLYQWRNNDYQYSGGSGYLRPFMAGLTCYSLVRYYELRGNTSWNAFFWPDILTCLKDFLGWMFETATTKEANPRRLWQGKGWIYTDRDTSTGGTNVTTDLNNLISPSYEFLGWWTGERKWIDYGDAQFNGIAIDNYFSIGESKQFIQMYVWVEDFFRWRNAF